MGEHTHGSEGALAEVRVELAGRLRARRGEIEEAIFARVSDQWFERVGPEDPEYVAGLRAAAGAALDYALTGIEHWGELLAPVPPQTTEQARRAARMGVGLETVLRRYFAGHAVLGDFMMQEAERGVLRGREAALREVLQVVPALADRLVVAVSDAYDKESELVDRRRGARKPGRTVVTGAQRERIVRALMEVVAEHGRSRASVGAIVERARVGRPTFYKLFPGGIDDGLVEVIDRGLEQVGVVVARAFEGQECWRDGMRAGMASVLAFFDTEPALARILMVETLGGGPVVLTHRAQAVQAFRQLVLAAIESEVSSEVPGALPLAAESLLASVMEIVRMRLSTPEPRPLIELTGPLIGSIIEHVACPEMAAEEARRAEELARAIQAGEVDWAPVASAPVVESSVTLPAVLANPNARRARECVLYLAEHPESSNSEIAAGTGVTQKSQMSSLLRSLWREDLLNKHSEGPGRRNAWRLTPRGEEVARALVVRSV